MTQNKLSLSAGNDSGLSRRDFLAFAVAGGAAALLPSLPAAAAVPNPPPNASLVAGGPVADFALADPNNIEAAFANASNRAVGITPDGGAYASYQSADNLSSQYCGSKLENRTGVWNFSVGNSIAVELGFATQTNGDDYHNHTYVVVYLISDLNGFANYFRSPIVGPSTIKQSRETLVINKSEFSAIGAPAWERILRIEIRLHRTASFAGGPNGFTVYRVWSYVARTKLVFCFDDGLASVLDNAITPWFVPNNWRATIGVNSASVGQPGFLSLASLKFLHDSLGMDMSNHTARHTPLCYILNCTISGTTATYSTGAFPHQLVAGAKVAIRGFGDGLLNGLKTVATVPSTTTFTVELSAVPALTLGTGFGSIPITGLTDAQVDQRILECQNYLITNNLRQGNEFFIYPSGFYDINAKSRVQRLGFKSARTTRPGITVGGILTSGIAAFTPAHIDLFALPAISLSSANTRSNTGSKVLAIIDDAISRGTSAFIYAHDIVSTPTNSNEFAALEFNTLMTGVKQRVAQGLCTVESYSQWFAGLGS